MTNQNLSHPDREPAASPGRRCTRTTVGFTLTGTARPRRPVRRRPPDTVDEGKLREYRDLTSGLLSLLDLQGRSQTYHLDLFAENLGRTDSTST